MFNSHFVGPLSIIMGCSKNCSRTLIYRLSSQHPNVIWKMIFYPLRAFGGGIFGQGQLPHKETMIFWTHLETSTRFACFQKNHCPCILEGHFSTNPILSAFHLPGPKSNIYVHFHWVNKQLTGIPFLKWNRQ